MGEIVVLENLGLLLLKISKYKKIAFSYVPHTLPLGLSQQDPAGWVTWGQVRRENQLCGKMMWCFSRWQSFSESVQGQWWAWWQREAGRGKKREQSFSVSAILWAKCKYTSLSSGALERRGVFLLVQGCLPEWCPEVALPCWQLLLGACVWAAQQLPSLPLGPAGRGWSLLGVPFAFWRAGARGSFLADEILI